MVTGVGGFAASSVVGAAAADHFFSGERAG
jgi:hypothetical protein